ncbi:MAG TPA: hypothetical protein VFS20_01990 [Longimicrobium sp.]|nr:hypothetical protein [Longimicrobium sp.]
MDERRLDLSALDPARDPARWRAMVGATLARMDDVLVHRRQDALSLIAGWRRPLLAAAAAVLLVLLPVEFALERREARVKTVRGLVAASTAWAQEGRAPTGAELLRAMSTGAAP